MTFVCENPKCSKRGQQFDADMPSNVKKQYQATWKPKCTQCNSSAHVKKVEAVFQWNFDQEQQNTLQGGFDTQGVDNSVPETGADTRAPVYDSDKHYRLDNKGKEGVYFPDLVRGVDNHVTVRRMEDKAIEHGLRRAGEVFFKFNRNIGWDSKGSETACIRVDNPQLSTQHSHPIPETGSGEVVHRAKVLSSLSQAVREKDPESVVAVAEYLKVIGAPARSHVPNGNEKDKHFKGLTVPPGTYWTA